MKAQDAQAILVKKYVGNGSRERMQADITRAQNTNSINDFRSMVHNSGLPGLVLLMAETGVEWTVDSKKLAQGLPIEECLKMGVDLKPNVRQKYVELLINKTIPNDKERVGSEDQDNASRFAAYFEKEEKSKTSAEIAFDAKAEVVESDVG